MKKNEQLEALVKHIINETLLVLEAVFKTKDSNEKHLSLTIKDFMALDYDVLYMAANVITYMIRILELVESYIREHMSSAAKDYDNLKRLVAIFDDISSLSRKHSVEGLHFKQEDKDNV